MIKRVEQPGHVFMVEDTYRVDRGTGCHVSLPGLVIEKKLRRL